MIDLIQEPQDPKRYILRDRQPIPCNDETAYRAFTNNARNMLVANDSIGQFTIVTAFLGWNAGTEDEPLFFRSDIYGVDDYTPRYAADWDGAIENQQHFVGVAEAFIASQRGEGIQFKPAFVDLCPEGIVFTMETEAEARQAYLEGKIHQVRTQIRGNQVIINLKGPGQGEGQAHPDPERIS